MLNNIGLPGLLLIAIVLLVLFGKGKVSSLMGEVGKGITAFKKGVAEPVADPAADPVAEAARVETARVETARDVTPVADKDKV